MCSLDAELKRLQSNGVGSKRRQAEPLAEEEEEILWQKGLLGVSSPQTLLDTMLFMNGLYSHYAVGKNIDSSDSSHARLNSSRDPVRDPICSTLRTSPRIGQVV